MALHQMKCSVVLVADRGDQPQTVSTEPWMGDLKGYVYPCQLLKGKQDLICRDENISEEMKI